MFTRWIKDVFMYQHSSCADTFQYVYPLLLSFAMQGVQYWREWDAGQSVSEIKHMVEINWTSIRSVWHWH